MARVRTKQIVIRLTDQELDAVKMKVAESGLKQQEYLIRAITTKEIVNTDGMKTIVPELKRIGNNLNQVARNCNAGDQATHGEVQAIGEELNEVWRQLKRLAQGHLSEER